VGRSRRCRTSSNCSHPGLAPRAPAWTRAHRERPVGGQEHLLVGSSLPADSGRLSGETGFHVPDTRAPGTVWFGIEPTLRSPRLLGVDLEAPARSGFGRDGSSTRIGCSFALQDWPQPHCFWGLSAARRTTYQERTAAVIMLGINDACFALGQRWTKLSPARTLSLAKIDLASTERPAH